MAARFVVAAHIAPNLLEAANINMGITVIGKRAQVPACAIIGRNCRIDAKTYLQRLRLTASTEWRQRSTRMEQVAETLANWETLWRY